MASGIDTLAFDCWSIYLIYSTYSHGHDLTQEFPMTLPCYPLKLSNICDVLLHVTSTEFRNLSHEVLQPE